MTRVVSNTFSLTVVDPAAVPLWRQNMVPWQWKEIAGSSMNGVNPTTIPAGNTGPSGRINAWNGLTVDPGTNIVYCAAQGGHQDYAGNEVVTLNLGADSPAWSIIRQPTPSAQVLTDSSHYADGRPSARHSYYHVHFLPTRNRVFLIGAGFVWGTPAGGDGTHSFNVASGDWDGAGTYPNTTWANPVANATGGQAFDQSTEDVYFLRSNAAQLRRFNATAGTFTDLASIAGVNADIITNRPMVYDHTRGRALMIGDAYRPTIGGRVWTNNGGSGSWATFDFTGDGVSTLAGPNYNGAHYNATLDRVVVKASTGATVYLVDPTTYVSTAQTTSGGTPPNATNGVCGRFLYVSDLGGYVYYPTYTGNVWFLATE